MIDKYTGNQIFTGSPFKLVLSTGQDLSTASSAKIKYRKPNRAEGNVTADIDSPATGGTISYTFNTEIDQSGKWRFWSNVIFSDTFARSGEPIEIHIYPDGEAD